MSLSGHVGPNWQAGRNTEISLLANVRKNWVGASPYSSDIGAKLQVGHRLTRRINITGQAYWQRSDFRTSKFLDGPLRDFSLYGYWLITPTVRAEAAAGYARQRPNKPVVPQRQPLGADRRLGYTSTRLHLGCQLRIAPKTIQRRQYICYAGRFIAEGSDPYPARLSLQSRIHSVRLQPTTRDYQRGDKNPTDNSITTKALAPSSVSCDSSSNRLPSPTVKRSSFPEPREVFFYSGCEFLSLYGFYTIVLFWLEACLRPESKISSSVTTRHHT